MEVDGKAWLSVLAILMSGFSLLLTWRNWQQSNRPVVSAFVDEYSIGEGTATFNLSIANTGTRPATNVRIHLERSELDKLLDPSADAEFRMELASCFARDSKIPLLRNGEVLVGGLGRSSRVDSSSSQLIYGAEAVATIEYADLEGNTYKSLQPLKVYARNGFTGFIWQSIA